jgi:hypothetical protein
MRPPLSLDALEEQPRGQARETRGHEVEIRDLDRKEGEDEQGGGEREQRLGDGQLERGGNLRADGSVSPRLIA